METEKWLRRILIGCGMVMLLFAMSMASNIPVENYIGLTLMFLIAGVALIITGAVKDDNI